MGNSVNGKKLQRLYEKFPTYRRKPSLTLYHMAVEQEYELASWFVRLRSFQVSEYVSCNEQDAADCCHLLAYGGAKTIDLMRHLYPSLDGICNDCVHHDNCCDSETILHIYARIGFMAGVRYICDIWKKCLTAETFLRELNYRETDGMNTPFMLAVLGGHEDVALLLVDEYSAEVHHRPFGDATLTLMDIIDDTESVKSSKRLNKLLAS